MKIVFAFVALLVCANLDFCRAASSFENQTTSETEGEKINARTSDDSGFQHPNKPSAHIESTDRRVVTYNANQVITDWSVHVQYSHLEGGMQYQAGFLTVPVSGRYYIYTQLYFRNKARAYVRVNNQIITMIQSATGDEASLYTGGLFKLNAGDKISLAAANTLKLYMLSVHSYFGAYLI